MISILILGSFIAALIVLVVLVIRPEYILLLYGLSIGFPDISANVGGVINIRLDDLLIILLFIRLVITLKPLSVTELQKKIISVYLIFLSYCLLSGALIVIFGGNVDSYVLIRDMGGGFTFVVLLLSVNSERSFRLFLFGLLLAGLAICFQVTQHFNEIALESLTDSNQIKDASSFSSWNPNTVGGYGILFSFSSAMAWYISPAKNWRKLSWSMMPVFFISLPLFTFARGATVSLVCGWILFLVFMRKWKVLLSAVGIAALLFAVWYQTFGDIISAAFDIDLKTGKGFSSRYDLWGNAFSLIKQSPLWGHGYGQEARLFILTYGRGMSHNAYFSILVELGLFGLLVLLWQLYNYYYAAIRLFRKNRPNMGSYLIIAFMTSICIDSLSGSGLYGSKYITLLLAIIAVFIGFLEKESQEGLWNRIS